MQRISKMMVVFLVVALVISVFAPATLAHKKDKNKKRGVKGTPTEVGNNYVVITPKKGDPDVTVFVDANTIIRMEGQQPA